MVNVLRRLGATAVVVAAVTAGLAAPAESAPRWEIDRIYYDPPGADNRTNAHLNLERVEIVNRTSQIADLRGYTLRDVAGHVYRFATTTRVAPGGKVTVHTGRGTNTSGHKYWGMGNYVWNNPGDTAYLRNAPGTLIDSCRWTTIGTGTSNC